jgi:hypothetical protein
MRIAVSCVMSPEAYLHFMQREEIKQLHVVPSLQLLEVHCACHTVKEREEGRKGLRRYEGDFGLHITDTSDRDTTSDCFWYSIALQGKAR